jgi:hypothetical protein
LPKDLLLQVQAVPLAIIGKTVAVAMADPQDAGQVALLQSYTQYHVKPVQAPQIQIHQLLSTIKSSAPSLHTPPVAPRPGEQTPRGGAGQSSPQLPRLSGKSGPGARSGGSQRSATELLVASGLSPRAMVVTSSQSDLFGSSPRLVREGAPGSAGSGRAAISGHSPSSPGAARSVPPTLASGASSPGRPSPSSASGSSGIRPASAASSPRSAASASSASKGRPPLPGRRGLFENLPDLSAYKPWTIAFLLTASLAGAGYFLVKLRESRIEESVAAPLPPRPKPAPLPAAKPAPPEQPETGQDPAGPIEETQ